MSKFALTGVLLCILVGFFHYSPTSNPANVSVKTEKESLRFPISEQIKLARVEKHITSQELAKRVGLSEMNLEKIEKGQVVPTRDILFKIENELKVSFTLDGY